MVEEISRSQRVCRRPRLGASFLGVLHPHIPPREHWSYTHCILGRLMAAASSHLQASQCLSIPPTLPALLLASRFAGSMCRALGEQEAGNAMPFLLSLRKVVSAVFNGIGYTQQWCSLNTRGSISGEKEVNELSSMGKIRNHFSLRRGAQMLRSYHLKWWIMYTWKHKQSVQFMKCRMWQWRNSLCSDNHTMEDMLDEGSGLGKRDWHVKKPVHV